MPVSRIKSFSTKQKENHYQEYLNDGNQIHIAVDNKNNKYIGAIRLWDINWKNRIIDEMGIYFHPEYCLKGNGRLILLFLPEKVKEWQFNKMSLKVNEDNIKVITLYENIGFKNVMN